MHAILPGFGRVVRPGTPLGHRPAAATEADVLLTALDLADVRPMEPADMGEFLLRPIPGRAKLVDLLAQQYQ